MFERWPITEVFYAIEDRDHNALAGALADLEPGEIDSYDGGALRRARFLMDKTSEAMLLEAGADPALGQGSPVEEYIGPSLPSFRPPVTA